MTRYLLGTQDAYMKLRVGDPVLVGLVDYSDREWAGNPASRKSQSSGHVQTESCVATSSGMAVYYAMRPTAALEHFEFKVNTALFCDSVAARGIAQRAGLGKIKALEVKTLWL